jgi:hypothetical protein
MKTNFYPSGSFGRRLLGGFIIAGLLPASVAFAQSDQLNLENNFGVQLEDAYATEYGNREFQTYARFTRDNQGRHVTTLAPALEFGPFRNTQISVAAPFRLGNGDRTGSGNVQVSALYSFNTEGLVLPAIALAGQVEFPTGLDSKGVDYTLRFAATKTITQGIDRLHVNVRYTRNAMPTTQGEGPTLMSERPERWVTIIGYSRRITPTTLLVLDYVREQLRLQDENANTVELGFRRQINPRLVLSLGGGVGVGLESPKVQGTFGLQQAF